MNYIRGVNRLGSARKLAAELGIHPTTIQKAIQVVKKKAALAGYSPDHDMTRTVPHGFNVRGVSTYYDRDGEVRGQWVKSQANAEEREALFRAATEAMSEELPRLPPVAAPTATNDALCNLYTLTDCHVGMLAWHKEGGEDWDLTIAERTLVGCFAQMIRSAPPAKACVVNQLGDFLHYDGMLPVTPTSKHVLDADGRFSKMAATAVRILRRIIDMALDRHEAVHVILAEGNHDEASSVWLRIMFAALYENEPRVTVNDSELPFYVYRHGRTMLAFHHGHKLKNGALPGLFAAQYPEIWGATTRRYAHTGHRHHEETKEHAGMIVTQHPTLAARDAYAARGGWIAERKAVGITYHAEHGQVGTVTVTPEMLS